MEDDFKVDFYQILVLYEENYFSLAVVDLHFDR